MQNKYPMKKRIRQFLLWFSLPSNTFHHHQQFIHRLRRKGQGEGKGIDKGRRVKEGKEIRGRRKEEEESTSSTIRAIAHDFIIWSLTGIAFKHSVLKDLNNMNLFAWIAACVIGLNFFCNISVRSDVSQVLTRQSGLNFAQNFATCAKSKMITIFLLTDQNDRLRLRGGGRAWIKKTIKKATKKERQRKKRNIENTNLVSSVSPYESRCSCLA